VLAVTAGCVASTPGALSDCEQHGRRTLDISYVLASPDGNLYVGGKTAQFQNCYLDAPEGGWRPAIYRSGDRGLTWTGGPLPVSERFQTDALVWSLVRAVDGTLYASASASRTASNLEQVQASWLGRSRDGGQTWQAITPPDGALIAGSMATGGSSRLFASFCGSGAGVYRSNDAGDHWEFTGLKSADCATPLYTDGAATVIAYGRRDEGTGLYRSMDGGLTWSLLPIQTEFRVPQGVHRLLAGNADGLIVFNVSTPAAFGETQLHRSLDGGATWQSISRPSDQPLQALAVGASGQVIMVTSEELAWRPRAVFFSADRGGAWESLPYFQFRWQPGRSFDFADDGTLYQGVYARDPQQPVGTFGGKLRRSTDHGRTWETLTVLPPTVPQSAR
jgi:photosystem II stability/assembly factor-like uncharacterized protein